MLIKDLIEFGLSEKEAKVYLALLSLEVATVSEIAKSTGINRSTTYITLDTLGKKGFSSVSGDKSVQRFVATQPEALLRSAEKTAEKYNSIRSTIEKIVPELAALHKDTKQKPKVRVFQGTDGIKNSFDEILNCDERLFRAASSIHELLTHLPGYFPKFMEKKISKKIRMRGIHPLENLPMEITQRIPINEYNQPIMIPKEKYGFSANMAIFDNKIHYASFENGGIAIIIESKEISDVMKSVFDLAWEEAKRLQSVMILKKNTGLRTSIEFEKKSAQRLIGRRSNTI